MNDVIAYQAYLEGRRAAREDAGIDQEVLDQLEADTVKAREAMEVSWLKRSFAL